MAEQVLNTVTVQFVSGQHGDRYQVLDREGKVTLHTARSTLDDWRRVERHVRALHDQRNAEEELARHLQQLVEEHGLESEIGGNAYSVLLEQGLE
jgi:hypothetical protein